ncbi:MAG: HAD family hydrolase [Ruminiclostridium sp.]|nr:HAD family hydrolase [Ruminiclostridium sp.]
MFSKITHVFFDVGSTLVDETECYNHRIYDAIAGTDITFEQFTEKRIFFQKQNLKGDLEAIKFFGLKKTPWHREDERLYPETEEILQYLHDKNYIIGAIANQDFGTEKRLEEYGIRSYFSSITASAEEGVAKPDPEIFRRAFKSAGCSSEKSVMIGDRLDNDIAPAKALGMKTIWIKQGFSAYCSPTCPQEQPDYTIVNLLELKNILY